jgi:N-acetylneuraminic acid mutarotase
MLVAVVLAIGAHPNAVQARDLSFAERLEAQRTIDRFYYEHQTGSHAPFDEAVPVEVTRRKVLLYLQESAALEKIWHHYITPEALQRELERISRSSRLPDRLHNLDERLGNDPVLIAECLARPVLVRRLTRNFFAYDRTIHAESLRTAERLRKAIESGLSWMGGTAATREETELVVGPASDAVSPSVDAPRFQVTPERFRSLGARLPERPGEVGPIEEARDAFVVRVLRERRPDRLRYETYRVEKKAWGTWWAEVSEDLDGTTIRTVAGAVALPPSKSADRSEDAVSPCAPDNTWDNGTLDNVVERANHTLVWTGSEMLVWGGEHGVRGDSFALHSGSRYDPVLDVWAGMSEEGAPEGREDHVAVWTGEEMIIWGGGSRLNTGGRYDPVLDRWTPTSTVGAPTGRRGQAAVWTGKEMIVWGGQYNGQPLDTGGRYDPVLDRWTPTSTTNAPEGRWDPSLVWTGKYMIAWGGTTMFDGVGLATGGRYDPETDTWTPTSLTGAPEARFQHTAVWSGSRMIVWGGTQDSDLLTLYQNGALYDPATDTWTPTSLAGAPSPRAGHTAVWSGSRMIVWGGASSPGTFLADGGQYDPVQDLWSPVTDENSPRLGFGLAYHRAVWADTQMIVWGGMEPVEPPMNWGGRYDPVADVWTPTSRGEGPSGRQLHSAVWTGNEMIVWGGCCNERSDGGRYDPMLDAWAEVTNQGAPEPRLLHTAVWTGQEMIVWGGRDHAITVDYDTGYRYDPMADTWTPVTLTGAPPARYDHVAAWTGSEMLVWGGVTIEGATLRTGAAYDPVQNDWRDMRTTGAPSARRRHVAVWTGTRLVVWGGFSATGIPLDTGGRYDPVADSWSSTSTSGAPQARLHHTGVWTGSKMIVWGGHNGLMAVNTGGRYDPVSNSWQATSLAGAPELRLQHAATWAGTEMIVWGGDEFPNSFGAEYNSGGRYNPSTDTWTSTSQVNVPYARDNLPVVWTGEHMLVWGGDSEEYTSGGRYAVGNPDGDADGVADACDCAPADGAAFDTPGEVVRFLVGADRTTLTWYSAAGTSGTGTVHDVLRGTLQELPVGTGVGESCVASGVAEARAEDPELPPTAQGFWYLVRGRNACGAGTYGFESGGDERMSATCP